MPAGVRSPYQEIVSLSEAATCAPSAFTGLIATAPQSIQREAWSQLDRRNLKVREWQRTALDLFAASVRGDLPRTLADSILGHLPDHLGWGHHRGCPLGTAGTPMFFRTDQAADGTILEVQCPGSLWGVHEILSEFYAGAGLLDAHRIVPLSARFVSEVRTRIGAQPVIHHLLDNSSHPAGERFFIQRARRTALYFGYDLDIRPQDCNFVRGHDFFSLMTENFSSERRRRLAAGEPIYDLPPIVLFDQKLLLSFPFSSDTREHFDDATRKLFPHTTLVTPRGLQLEDGGSPTLEQFAALPRARRGYFLKYAGSDVARNWGSRAVFHLGKLSSEACERRLREVTSGWAWGERWIVQKEQSSEEQISFTTREGGIETTSEHSKHSVFYGPGGAMAVLIMFESFFKVHGSTETITTIGVSEDCMAQVDA
jgi:hypothetical protein